MAAAGGSLIGTIAGDAGKGAAIGAAIGALLGGRRRLGVIIELRKLASINTRPWGVYRQKTVNAIDSFLHNQWLNAIEYADTSLYRISVRHLKTDTR